MNREPRTPALNRSRLIRHHKIVIALTASVLGCTAWLTSACTMTRPASDLNHMSGTSSISLRMRNGEEIDVHSWGLIGDTLLIGYDDYTRWNFPVDSLESVSCPDTVKTKLLVTGLTIVGGAVGAVGTYYLVQSLVAAVTKLGFGR